MARNDRGADALLGKVGQTDREEGACTGKAPNAGNGAAREACCSCTYDSPVGMLTLAASDDGLKGIWMEGQKYFGSSLDAGLEPCACENDHLRQACAWLDDYFAGGNPSRDDLVLAPTGSEFRQVVWRLLCEIPLGEVRTYGELAKEAACRMGKARMSAQATGGAVGHNPISIIIPCHRVVGANGSLTGYAGGIARKLQLLEHEGVDCSGLFVPKKSTAP